MSEELINTILQYLPTIIVVVEMVLLAFGQKTNLINGLRLIADKAEEIKSSAEFEQVQIKMLALIEEQKELINEIKKLRNEINKIQDKE